MQSPAEETLTWRRITGGGGDADDLKKRTGPAAEVEAGFEAGQEPPVPLPPARWRHSATLTSQTSLMIFGGFLSHDERLNDMWMFDTVRDRRHSFGAHKRILDLSIP